MIEHFDTYREARLRYRDIKTHIRSGELSLRSET